MTDVALGPERAPEADGIEASPPHAVSMVVWGTPAPAIVGKPAWVKVGAQCEHGCDLTGQAVTLNAKDGGVAATAVFDQSTDSLHWAEVALPVSNATGISYLNVECAPAKAETNAEGPEHSDARAAFSLRTDPNPEHMAVITVVREADGAPVDQVEVRMNNYTAYSDTAGQVRLALPGGTYALSIRKFGFSAEPQEIEVREDLAFEVLAGKGKTREELEARLSAWENYPWS